MRLRSGAKGGSGFTVIELVVTLAIIAILVAFAVPSFLSYLPKWRLEGASNSIGHIFSEARFEAIKRNRPVLVLINGAGTPGSSITLIRDNNRNNSNDAGEPQISNESIGQQNKGVFLASALDCGGANVTQLTLGIDGTIRQITGGSRGVMPLVVTMDSSAVTDPNQYFVIIERSGISRVATTNPCGGP